MSQSKKKKQNPKEKKNQDPWFSEILKFCQNEIQKKNIISNPQSAKSIHYIKEMTRNWNKINFAANKTLRALKIPKNISVKSPYKKGILYTISYMTIWEGISWKHLRNLIVHELKAKKMPSMQILVIFFEKFYLKAKTFNWGVALDGKSELEKISILESIPSFFLETLSSVLITDDIRNNIQAMNSYNDHRVSVRIRKIFCPKQEDFDRYVQQIINELELIHILTRKDPEFNDLVYVPIKDKAKLIKSNLYQSNKIIIQQKPSMATIKLLEIENFELIGDFCAAPGSKSNYILDLCHNSNSRVISMDLHIERVEEMRHFLGNQGNIGHTICNSDGIHPPFRTKLEGIFDRILVDAPCTGSGTFLEHPELKNRQSSYFLRQNQFLQTAILSQAIKYLKPGGILVYSTCSLYREEGEDIIIQFLDKLEPYPFELDVKPCYKLKDNKKTKLIACGRYFPAIHKTQGFFLARFKKI